MAPVTRTEELVFLAAGLWIAVGLCLDGWAHRNRPELESFFTPWHGVLYSGFAAATAWLAVIVIRRRPTTPTLVAAIPPGYELAVVGFGLFTLGAVGDGIWHTIFGVETSLDALLSPTHLLLLIGISMAVVAPIRAAERLGLPANPTRQEFVGVALSATLLSIAVAFFFLYANGFNNWPMNRPYAPGESDMLAGYGVLSTLASTVILIGITLYLLARWRTPFGTFILLYGLVGGFLSGLDAFESWWQILAPLAGGLTADLLITARRSASPAIVGLVVPLVMWSVSTLALHSALGVLWPPELWVGQVVMAMLTGLALAQLARDSDSSRAREFA